MYVLCTRHCARYDTYLVSFIFIKLYGALLVTITESLTLLKEANNLSKDYS